MAGTIGFGPKCPFADNSQAITSFQMTRSPQAAGWIDASSGSPGCHGSFDRRGSPGSDLPSGKRTKVGGGNDGERDDRER